jgi:predicted DNA-binding transcriptional regulator AlpA
MPDSSYRSSAKSLDVKRLGKQRVEAYQILRALSGVSKGWVHHPATKMWIGYEWQLANYGYTMCDEWIARGFTDSLKPIFHEYMASHPMCKKPWWVNNRILQITHQSNLLRKDWNYYSNFFRVPDDIPYLWPLPDEEAFLCGNLTERKNTELLKNGVVYLTSTQVASLLGVSAKTISAYKARGQMPPPDRIYGRTPLWRHSTIEAWRGTLRTPVFPIEK